MECSHLKQSVDISPSFIKKLIKENRNLWACLDCRSNKSSWMCLKCGQVLCGRYVSGHCKSHSESNPGHFVCMDTALMVFCYKCDEFVINDTPTADIQLIRTALETQSINGMSKRSRSKEDSPPSTPERKRTKASSKENMYTTQSPVRASKTVGLRNLGNTCFMNAILQSLSNLKGFSGYFKELPAIEVGNVNGLDGKRKYYTRRTQNDDKGCLVEELRKILCALWQGNTKAICPDALFSVIWKVVPRFRGYQQHDAHEFMHYLLDCVHNELLQAPMFSYQTDTIVTGIFGGQLQSEVTCKSCGAISKTDELYLDLSLDIPSKNAKVSSRGRTSPVSKNDKGNTCLLTDCLQRFVAVETLTESEWYMCAKCKKRQPSTKKFWISRLPNVLCLHLKRFRYTAFGRSKVDTQVRFPIKELDMNPYLLKTREQRKHRLGPRAHIYDLAAVVVHRGGGAGSGHYTAYARHEGSWYNFNDSCVSLAHEETVAKCKGYILFYTRQYPDTSIIELIKDNAQLVHR